MEIVVKAMFRSVGAWTLTAALALSTFARASAAADPPPAPTLAQQCLGAAAPAQRAKACGALLDGRLSSGDRALIRYFRALAEIDLTQLPAARADLDQAVEDDGTLWMARWARVEVYRGMRHYRTDAEDMSVIIKLFPTLPSAYERRALALDLEGDWTAAVADFSKAIDLAGAQAKAYYYGERAGAYYGVHDLDHAKADFDEAIRRAPEDVATLNDRSHILYLQGDYAAASADTAKVAEMGPPDNYHLIWHYLAELRLGHDAATELENKARGVNLSEWPGPIIGALLGKMSRDQFPVPAVPQGWSAQDRKAGADCEADFFLGEASLIKGDRDQARTLFQAAVATGIKEYIEYRAAQIELERMKP